MSLLQVLTNLAAGLTAGIVNTIVGSGSILTFPALLAAGYSPLVANVSNTVGLVLGNLAGVVGYRRELDRQKKRVVILAIPAAAGGLLGAVRPAKAQRTENVIAAVVNGVAAVVFVIAAHVAWTAAGLLAVSGIAGGLLGASVGRRLPANVLRALIVIVGLAAVVKLVVS